jgi:hypothetical protein
MWVNWTVRPCLALVSACVVIAATVGSPAKAAGDPRPPLTDIGILEKFTGMVTQWGIMFLRSQVDITYDGVSSDLYAGRANISGITMWPRPPWDTDNQCSVRADRLQVSGAEVTDWDRVRVRFELIGVDADLACLPPDVAGTVAGAGITELKADRAYIDVDYRMSSSSLTVSSHVAMPGLAAISVGVDFPYFAVHGEGRLPTLALKRVAVEIEDQGLWEKVSPLLPPEMTSPDAVEQIVQAGLTGQLEQLNLRSTQVTTLNREQIAFISSAALQAKAFVARPGSIVIQTTLDNPYRELDGLERTPKRAFEVLKPLVSAQPSTRQNIISVKLLKRGINKPSALSDEDKLRVGQALMSGVGAPKSAAAGQALLAPLAANGNGEAALALANAIAAGDPAAAYSLALQAGASGAFGATGLLDQLEANVDTPSVLTMQAAALPKGVGPKDAAAASGVVSLGDMRAMAMGYLRGMGMTRSYRMAYFWASLGAAAGDEASLSLVSDIEARMRHRGKVAADAWAAIGGEAAQAALDLRVSADYPAAFGQK